MADIVFNLMLGSAFAWWFVSVFLYEDQPLHFVAAAIVLLACAVYFRSGQC